MSTYAKATVDVEKMENGEWRIDEGQLPTSNFLLRISYLCSLSFVVCRLWVVSSSDPPSADCIENLIDEIATLTLAMTFRNG